MKDGKIYVRGKWYRPVLVEENESCDHCDIGMDVCRWECDQFDEDNVDEFIALKLCTKEEKI